MFVNTHAYAGVHPGFDTWRRQPESKLYDCRVLQRNISELTGLITKGDVFNLIFRLRGSLTRAQFGMLHDGLFSHAFAGTKLLVEEYHDTVCSALNYVADSDTEANEIPTEVSCTPFYSAHTSHVAIKCRQSWRSSTRHATRTGAQHCFYLVAQRWATTM
jgi:hypothetical protein